MNSDRIKEIQQTTAYPDSVSVKQALLQVWNECGQEVEPLLSTVKRLQEEKKEWISVKERLPVAHLCQYIHHLENRIKQLENPHSEL